MSVSRRKDNIDNEHVNYWWPTRRDCEIEDICKNQEHKKQKNRFSFVMTFENTLHLIASIVIIIEIR